jgi:pimeloyl-ACP methyl ester carboxylesterase
MMKPSLLILHGALGCAEQFAGWKIALSDKFDCHTFDFSGHGSRSGMETAFSIELFSHELEEFVLSKNLRQPHVLGYSMGGYVALVAALRKEELLGNIMTLATKFDWSPESSRKEAGYLRPEFMSQKVPQLAQQLRQRHGDHWEKVVTKTAEMMLQLGERPPLDNENINRAKNKIKFCVGDKDKMVSINETFRMFQASASAEFCVLPATAHLPETINLKRIVFEAEEFFLRLQDTRGARG